MQIPPATVLRVPPALAICDVRACAAAACALCRGIYLQLNSGRGAATRAQSQDSVHCGMWLRSPGTRPIGRMQWAPRMGAFYVTDSHSKLLYC